MNVETRSFLAEHAALLCCPRCGGDLAVDESALRCGGCAQDYPLDAEIPLLFAPNEWGGERRDVTEEIRAFYEDSPFPNYDDTDSVASLVQKARSGRFAKLLDDQVPVGARVLECGCGTGQLSNFLSIASRTVFGTDLCLNSLRLGQEFKEKNGLKQVHFFQMNLFRPAFRPGSFDLVVSNGVLHHTADPRLAFETIARLVRPGGYLLVGLYHRYGRLITDARRAIYRVTRDRFLGLDPNLRAQGMRSAKRRAWFLDQYKNPHESKHTIAEVMGWLGGIGFEFVSSLPKTRPFQPVAAEEPLFVPQEPGNRLERLIAELSMVREGSREGGFFIVIGRRTAD